MEISTQPILAPTNDPSTSSSHGTAATILCCICATPIHPNPSNTCPSCLASTADVTRGISTEATLHQCRGCSRWHHDAGKWIGCELESRELMGLCLGNVSGLKKRKGEGVEGRVRLVDAAWVWTEPHSMRLKVRCDICSCEEIRVMFDVSSSFVLRWYTEGSRMASRAVQRGTDLPLFAHTSCLCLSSLIVLRFLISCNDTHYNHHNQNTRITDPSHNPTRSSHRHNPTTILHRNLYRP